MTLRKKLILSTALEIILVIVVSVFLVVSSKQENHVVSKETRASKIVETISQIRFATFENLLHHDERSFEQWKSKHEQLSSLLEPTAQHNAAERQILSDILNDSRDVSSNFNRLVKTYSETMPGQDETIRQAFQERLATRLLTRQQAQITQAFKLSDMARQEAATLRHRANQLVTIIVLLMLVIMAVNSFFVAGTIAKALRIFQKGAEKIASGKFDYRIKSGKPNDELGQLAAAFNSMAANLEQIDKAKADFILLASHQLRTPLTSIKWSSEALIAPNSSLTEDKKQHYINQIHDSNQRMIKLVNELLDATKVGLGTSSINPESTILTPIYEQVINDLAPLTRGNKISIEADIDDRLPAVWINPTWVHIIFQNLLSNAIKYSPAGESVKTSIQRQGDDVLIKVKDKGCGIPMNQQDKIFSKLFRADNAKKIIGEGSGLGLYITKAFVEQSGGTIWFESAENKGSIFYVKLPVEGPKPV